MTGNIILFIVSILPICGAFIGYLIGRKNKNIRDYFDWGVCIIEFILLLFLLIQGLNGITMECFMPFICNRGLTFKLDGFRAIYIVICGLMWMMTTIFSKEYMEHYHNRNRYYLFTLITFAATEGVFLSNDLFTTFIFFEIMSFTSYIMVVHTEEEKAMKAGDVYIAVAIIGGMVMLMGLFLLYNITGTLDFELLYKAISKLNNKSILLLPSILILFGFGAKAGMFPLHIWLPKAHPVAPAPASALLSGILTKAGVFGMLVVNANIMYHNETWSKIIFSLAIITMFLGALLAVFSIDLKRTLACSSMSQIGFIMIGIAMQGLLGHHNGLAVWGTVLHMLNHSLIKLALFMAAGVVYINLHELDLNKIRGFGRGKKLLNFIFLMGVLGIIGMPLWNGYISKTLLHESIVEYIEILEEEGLPFLMYKISEWIFLISGGLTVAYMTKLYVCIFIEKNNDINAFHHAKTPYMNKISAFVITVSASILPILGFFPHIFMDKIGTMAESFMRGSHPAHEIAYFSFTNIKGALISLLIGALVYLLFIRNVLIRKNEKGEKVYVNIWPKSLDIETLIYRPVIQVFLPNIFGFIFKILAESIDFLTWKVIYFFGFILKIIAESVDFIIWLLSKTLMKTIKIPIKNDTDFKNGDTLPIKKDAPVSSVITSSFSFSLLLFGIGLLAIMIYLIFLMAK
ncbi:MAG: proton-conducting transporter membrane subunit [Eubacteriales bacterium]|nr:proton-conducting transporter membrane subunit [Eubacteriales bacterium]